MSIPWGLVLPLAALLVVLILTLRRPLLALLGTRHAFRRPQHLLIVAIGLMVATAILTGANVAGDSFMESALDGIDERLGASDVVVETRDPQPESRFYEVAQDPTIAHLTDHVAVVLRSAGSAEAPRTDLGEPRIAVWGIDPVELRALGGLRAEEGTPPASLGGWSADDAVVNRALAERLQLVVGDAVTVYVLGDGVAGTERDLQVRAIVADTASAPPEGGPVVYVARGTLGEEDTGNLMLVSAARGTATKELAAAMGPVASSLLGDAERATVTTDVRTQQETAAREESGLRFMFLALGSFSILAGVFLIVSLMAMLVDERKSELATMRATGALRGEVSQLQLHEGFVYALCGMTLGIGVGIGLAALLVAGASTFSFYQGETLRLVVKPLTIATSAGLGLFMTLFVMGVTAHRSSGFNIARALRGEESTTRSGRRLGVLLALVALAAGGILTALAFDGGPWFMVLGPATLAFGLALMSDRWLPKAVGGAVWLGLVAYIVASFLFIDTLDDWEFLLFPVRALLLILGGALVLVRSGLPPRVAAWLVRPFKRVDPVADPAFSYVQRRPARTVLTVTMVGLVVLILVLLGTMYGMFSQSVTEDTWSGFDVVGTSVRPLDTPPIVGAGALAHAERALTLHAAAGGMYAVLDHDGFWSVSPDLIALTPQAVDSLDMEATALGAAHPDGAAALRAVLDDPSLIVVSDYLWLDNSSEARGGHEAQPGETLRFRLIDNGTTNVTIAAVVNTQGFGGVFVHPDLFDRLDMPPAGTRIFATSDAVTDPAVLAREIESAYRHTGMDAYATREPIQAQQKDARTQLFLLQSFVGLGLLVGVASIGIITARNVLERRREIGVMRAIGYDSNSVVKVFLIEAGYVVTVATLLGTAGGLMTAYGMFKVEMEQWGLDFVINWPNLVVVAVLVYVTSVVAAWFPAQKVSRIPPAQATRYSE